MKKALSLIIILMLALPGAGAAELTRDIYPVKKGVDLIKMFRYTDDGVQNISIVRADLNNENLYVKPLFSPEGSHKLKRVENLVEENHAIAGINADFFGWGEESGTGSAIGYNAADGEIITSPCITEDVAAVGVTAENEFVFDYFSRYISVTAPDGAVCEIKHINKYDDLSAPVLYDRHWGKYSLGSHGTLAEVVVENNVVKEIRRDMPPVAIPENGYVIAGLTDITPFLIENLHEGDEVKLTTEISPSYNCTQVIGGGTLLIKNGMAAPNTHNIGGRNPRSAFGVDKTGKIIYLVAVDGRGDGIGMTLSELRDFMFEIGVYNAINFDGGGSTQLALRQEGKWDVGTVNSPSQVPYRRVINALGLMDKKYERSLWGGVYSEDFSAASTALYTYPDSVNASYGITEDGRGKLTYDFGDSERLQSAGFSLSSPAVITEKNTSISIDVYASENNKQWLRFMLTDANGEVQRLDLADEINWNGMKTLTSKIPDDIALPAKLTRIYIVQPGLEVKSAGDIYFDNLTVDGQKALNLAVTAGTEDNGTLLSKITKANVKTELSDYSGSLVLSGGISGSIARGDGLTDELSGITLAQCGSEFSAPDDCADALAVVTSETAAADSAFTEAAQSRAAKLAAAGKKMYIIYKSAKTAVYDRGDITYIALSPLSPSISGGRKKLDILNFYKKDGKVLYEIIRHSIW